MSPPTSQLQCRSRAHYPYSCVGYFQKDGSIFSTPATGVSHLPK